LSTVTETDVRQETPLLLDFEDNRLLAPLYGEHDRNLARIEQHLGVRIVNRGNRIAIEGPPAAQAQARDVLLDLYTQLERRGHIEPGDVDGALRMSEKPAPPPAGTQERSATGRDVSIPTRNRVIRPRSPMQATFIEALQSCELTFGIGPAGTGKTYLAVAMAVSALLAGEVDRIILSRPAVEAGENLGFLPGDLKEKVDPYLRPLYDALYDMMPPEQVEKRLLSRQIEVAPLAYMRGRTLSHAFVILDEAQNTTSMQIKMFLTRLGERSRMAVCGDPSQIDLPQATRSGLAHAVGLLERIEGVAVVRFGEADIVRNPLVSKIVAAYDGDTGNRA